MGKNSDLSLPGVALIVIGVVLMGIYIPKAVEESRLREGAVLAEEVEGFLNAAEEIPFVRGKGHEISKEHEIYITHITPISTEETSFHIRAFDYPKDMIFEVPRDRISEFVWFLVGKSRYREPEDTQVRRIVYEVEGWMLWRTTYYGPLPSEEGVKIASCNYDDGCAKALLKWLTEH